MPCSARLAEVARHVAARQDAGVDLGVEGLDLAADERRRVRQVADGRDLDAVGGERLAGAVGGEELDAQVEQVAGEVGDPVAIGDREQGSHTVTSLG